MVRVQVLAVIEACSAMMDELAQVDHVVLSTEGSGEGQMLVIELERAAFKVLEAQLAGMPGVWLDRL